MEHLSRRTLLRGSIGASGIAGASLVGSALLDSSYAAFPKIRTALDRTAYQPGDRMRLTLVESIKRPTRVRVRDSSGLVWKRVSRSDRKIVWTATATGPGVGVVTIVMRRSDGRVFRRELGYSIGGGAPGPTSVPLIGMSAPADVWHQRVQEVGAGLGARRIFADLASGYTSQIQLVEEAHAAGLVPVISYKVGGNAGGAVNGSFNAVAEQAAAKLASYGRPTAVSFWHEPHGDMSPADYVAASKQILPIFKRGELRVGPLLNGWLLDRQAATFASYAPDDLFAIWDWVGIDTYESGTMEAPGDEKPAQRIPALSSFVKGRGFDLPLAVGEYNGYSAATIAAAGEALLTTPNVWFGCVWNSTGGKGFELTGDRLAAFQQTLSDPRNARAIG